MTSILEMRTNIVVKLATCLLLASALHMTFAAPPAVAAAAANRFHVDTRSSDDQNSRDLNLLASSSSSDEDLERRLQMHRLKRIIALNYNSDKALDRYYNGEQVRNPLVRYVLNKFQKNPKALNMYMNQLKNKKYDQNYAEEDDDWVQTRFRF